MGKPKLARRNPATSVSQLNPPKVKTLPVAAFDENGVPVVTPKMSALPRYENAAKPRPHTIEGVIRPAKQ